jgi:hypothetical protein
VQGFGGNLPSVLDDEYNCVDMMWPFAAGEVVFDIDTSNSPYELLKLEISANAPIFVYTSCDTDSIIAFNTGEHLNCQGVCIDQVTRGEHFLVIMDWTWQGTYDFTIGVQCLPTTPLGDTCLNPIVDLAGSGSFTTGVCTAGHRDDYSNLTSCSQFGHWSADVIYAFCLAPGGQFHARLYDQCVRFSAMYLFTDCNDPNGSCVGFSQDILGTAIDLFWANGSSEPDTVYLGLDNTCNEGHSRRFGYNASLDVTYDKCPPTGACCLLDGTCVQRTDAQCFGTGGAFWLGYSVPCNPNPCIQLGACCLVSNGVCVLKNSESACLQAAGFWMGPGSVCSPDPCVGACCKAGGFCVMRGLTACGQEQGVFRGFGTTCVPNPCPTTGADGTAAAAGSIVLSAMPNPFTGKTTVAYAIPRAGAIHLGIYDASGRFIRTLVARNEIAGTGSVEWDGRTDDGHPVPPGVYFCRLTVDGVASSRTLIMIE